MTRKLLTAGVAAVLLSATAFAAAAQELLLGYLPAAGGPFATFSKTNLVAAEMAVNEINAAGGVNGKKLKIVSFDTAGKPDQAVVGLRKLAEDDKVLAIIGPFSSSECRVAFPAADRAGVTVMSIGSPRDCLPTNAVNNFFYGGLDAAPQAVQAERMRVSEKTRLPVEIVSDEFMARHGNYYNIFADMKQAALDSALTAPVVTAGSYAELALCERRGDNRVGRIIVGDALGENADRAIASMGRADLRFRPVDGEHARAALGEQRRRRAPDAGGCARDDGELAGQIDHRFAPVF